MVICDITQAYTPTSGGIRTFIDAKRSYIDEHTPHRHVLIVPGERDEIERDGRHVTYRVRSPIIPGAAPYRFFTSLPRLRTLLHEVNPDIAEVHTLYTEALAVAGRARKRPHLFATAVYHTDLTNAYVGDTATRFLGARMGSLARKGAEAFVRKLASNLDYIVSYSPLQRQRLESIGIDNIYDIQLGVDLDVFRPSRRDLQFRQEIGMSQDGILLVYAGRLDSEKRVHVLADAVGALPDELGAKLLVAGNGPHRAQLEERAAAGEPIVVLPFVTSKQELARILASSDVYVTAGPHETFGLSVVEAQACGLPVVGVNAGALTERVDETTGRLGPVDDALAMARNVEQVVTQRKALGMAARALVERQYGWDQTFQALFGLYERHQPF